MQPKQMMAYIAGAAMIGGSFLGAKAVLADEGDVEIEQVEPATETAAVSGEATGEQRSPELTADPAATGQYPADEEPEADGDPEGPEYGEDEDNDDGEDADDHDDEDDQDADDHDDEDDQDDRDDEDDDD